MAALLNRARMSTATTGTGTVTLGSAVTGYATFAEAGAVNATVYSYCIEDGDDFEIGVGTYTSSGTTFSRNTVTLSKISGTAGTSKINLSGTAEIFVTLRQADLGGLPVGGTAGQILQKQSSVDADADWEDPVAIVDGTWTPSLKGLTIAGSPTFATNGQFGSYYKQGTRVDFACRLHLAVGGIGGMTGTIRITGLPFAVRTPAVSSTEFFVATVVMNFVDFSASYTSGYAFPVAATTEIAIGQQGDNIVLANLASTNLIDTGTTATTTVIYINGHYFTSP